MTDDETISEKDFENFEDKPREEQVETLRRLQNKLSDEEGLSGLVQQLGLEGEVTVRVLDEDGKEKKVEKESFNK